MIHITFNSRIDDKFRIDQRCNDFRMSYVSKRTCDTCGKKFDWYKFGPVSWKWSESTSEFCSYKCMKNSPGNKFRRGGHGRQWGENIYQYWIVNTCFRLNLFNWLKDIDLPEFWIRR